MPGKDIVRMSLKELKRLKVVQKVLDKAIKQIEAAEILKISDRQTRRIIERVIREGDKGVVNRLRGRPSNRKLPEGLKQKVIKLYRAKYSDFGPTFAWEKITDEGIKISAQTMRNWLIAENVWQKRRKTRKHCRWRKRRKCFGEMVQIDGSHHAWLEDRGPELVLMWYIDDATSRAYGRFYDYEGKLPAMDSFKRYVKRYGIPHSVYLDRHTTYKSPSKPTIEDELANRKPLSEFERALKELGVEVIHAYSPQAKGRVERSFRTLQDRLVKEMRLKGIRTKDEANGFLGSYYAIHNKKFSVKPAEARTLFRDRPEGLELDAVLCLKTKRFVRNDFTVAHNRKLYQIIERTNVKNVVVEERISGMILIKHKGRSLKFKELVVRPERTAKPTASKPKKPYLPPKDHPWRRSAVVNRNRTLLNV